MKKQEEKTVKRSSYYGNRNSFLKPVIQSYWYPADNVDIDPQRLMAVCIETMRNNLVSQFIKSKGKKEQEKLHPVLTVIAKLECLFKNPEEKNWLTTKELSTLFECDRCYRVLAENEKYWPEVFRKNCKARAKAGTVPIPDWNLASQEFYRVYYETAANLGIFIKPLEAGATKRNPGELNTFDDLLDDETPSPSI